MWCASRRPPLGVRLFLSHFAVSLRFLPRPSCQPFSQALSCESYFLSVNRWRESGAPTTTTPLFRAQMSESRPRKRGREGKDVPFDIESLNKFLGSEEELLRNKAKACRRQHLRAPPPHPHGTREGSPSVPRCPPFLRKSSTAISSPTRLRQQRSTPASLLSLRTRRRSTTALWPTCRSS